MWGFLSPTGALIQESLGRDLYTVGIVFGGKEYWKDWQKGVEQQTVAPVPDRRENGLERTLGNLVKTAEAQQKLFIPFATAPIGAWSWLRSCCLIRENDLFPQNQAFRVERLHLHPKQGQPFYPGRLNLRMKTDLFNSR
jgi:hypothetical protein